MAGYTKLFSEIIASSIWQKDSKARIVWITMLALANRKGEVVASVPGLAHIANVSLSECKKALKTLEVPGTTEDGIKKTDNGFQMLNFAFWWQKIKAEERQDYLRIKQAELRKRVKNEKQKG